MTIDQYANDKCCSCGGRFTGDEECLKYHNKCLPINKMVSEYIQNVTPSPPLDVKEAFVAIARLSQAPRLLRRACRVKKEALKKEGIKPNEG